MKELDVVVDVRPSQDTDELIVMKQKLAFSGEADLVGGPVETRVRFATRKAQVSLFSFANRHGKVTLAAKVKNVGVSPFVIDRVALVYEFEQPQDHATKGNAVMKLTGGSFKMVATDLSKTGLFLAGETREYILPEGMFDGAALTLVGLSPSKYRIVAYSGDEEVGWVGGEQIRPLLGKAKIKFHRRAQPLFDTLPEPSRLAVIQAAAPLRGIEPGEWPSAGATPLEHAPGTFVLEPSEDLVVLVIPTDDNSVEILDIVRKGGLDQFHEAGEGMEQ